MFKIVLSVLITMLTVGCGVPRYVDYFPYHDDGTPKPKIALVPVIDSSDAKVTWNVSEEITTSLYYELMNSGELYVALPQEIGPIWAQKNTIDFFGCDLSFARQFCNTDFIVAMELIEHSEGPCNTLQAIKSFPHCHAGNRLLTMKVRLKVIDVRYQTPTVALYEIVKSEYLVACSTGDSCHNGICWGEQGYSISPYGVLHHRMVFNLTERLEEVLLSLR